MKVLIVGAGPAGCALAHGLKKANIPFRIFDKGADVYRNRHWAFTLGWARPYLLDLLPAELSTQLNFCQVDPKVDCAAIGEDRIVLYNGQSREEAFTFPIPQAREINIRQFRFLCAEGLDVQYGKRFMNFELIENDDDEGNVRGGENTKRGVRLIFEDGTTEEGDIAVGVDGANSQMRYQLLGAKLATPEVLPFALMNFNCSYTAARALYLKERLHPLVDIAIHPSGHYLRTNVLDMPDYDDPSTWTFQVLSTWPFRNVEDYDNDDNDGSRLQRLKEHFATDGWSEPYKSVIEWIPEDTKILRDQLKIWKPVTWDNYGGQVTLCGDAAHAMTFHRGQGANNSIYDSHCFVEAMKAVQSGAQPLKQAVDEYDAKIIKRGQEEVQISKAQTFFTHDWDNFINSPVMKLGTNPSHTVKSVEKSR